MTTYVLEMRSTEDWGDVRYRDYTTSDHRAARFRLTPKIQFADSGHGVVPVVTEHAAGTPRRPRIMILQEYVKKHNPGGRRPS